MVDKESPDLEERVISEDEFMDELESNYQRASHNMVQWHKKANGYLTMRDEVYRLIRRRNIVEFYRTADDNVGYRVKGRKEEIGFRG